MRQANGLDCEAATADRRFVIQSEYEKEAVELARTHTWDVHGKDDANEKLRSGVLKIV